MERPDETQFFQDEEPQSSVVAQEDHALPKTEALFTPKITAKISISMESVVEALPPRSQESPKPCMPIMESSPRDLISSAPFAGSPRSKASPRLLDPSLLRTPSPKSESSPRGSPSPRQPLGSRLIGFFEKKGAKKFSKRRSLSCAEQSPQELSGVNLQQRKYSNVEISPRPNDESDDHSPDKISPTKPKSSAYKIQKQKSFIGNNTQVISTEIQYSPRQRNQVEPSNSASPRSLSRRSSESAFKCALLLYCGTEIIAWCNGEGLKYEYHNTKDEFNILLENGDVIRIQGNNMHANSLEMTTVNKLIDLIKTLPHVENLSIYYDSQGIDIDECITSRLIASAEDTEAKSPNSASCI